MRSNASHVADHPARFGRGTARSYKTAEIQGVPAAWPPWKNRTRPGGRAPPGNLTRARTKPSGFVPACNTLTPSKIYSQFSWGDHREILGFHRRLINSGLVQTP